MIVKITEPTGNETTAPALFGISPERQQILREAFKTASVKLHSGQLLFSSWVREILSHAQDIQEAVFLGFMVGGFKNEMDNLKRTAEKTIREAMQEASNGNLTPPQTELKKQSVIN